MTKLFYCNKKLFNLNHNKIRFQNAVLPSLLVDSIMQIFYFLQKKEIKTFPLFLFNTIVNIEMHFVCQH